MLDSIGKKQANLCVVEQMLLEDKFWLTSFFVPFFIGVSDTEKFYTEVQEIILARYNKTFDWSLKAKMIGKKAIEAVRVFVEETGISDSLTAEDFLVEREEMLQKMFPTSDLMPGTILISTRNRLFIIYSFFQVSSFLPFLILYIRGADICT